MKIIKYNITFTLLIFFSISIFSQVPRNRLEKVGDRTEIIVSRHQLRRDKIELEAFRKQVEDFKLACSNRDENRVSEIQADLLYSMQREIDQSERKVFSAKKEVKRSSREIQNSRRDLNQSRTYRATRNASRGDEIRNMRDDRRDKRDDIRDYRGDKLDLVSQESRTRTQKQIFSTFQAQNFATANIVERRQIEDGILLNDFIETLEFDIQATKQELSEDRRELREDRRELRENRSERRERRQ